MQSDAKRVMPPKFNHNSTIKRSTAEKFSCFPTTEEEGSDEFADISETQSEINTEEIEFEDHPQSICSITKNKKNPFAAWLPFVPKPPEPVFQNLPAQPWWPDSSAPHSSSQEPTLTTISTERYNQTKLRTNAPNQNQGPMPNQSTTTTNLETMQANNQALQIQLEQALARIEQNVQNRNHAERISRSPRAIQTIQALEAAIAIFGQNKPDPEYEISEYAT
jgi:hypothetical protein